MISPIRDCVAHGEGLCGWLIRVICLPHYWKIQVKPPKCLFIVTLYSYRLLSGVCLALLLSGEAHQLAHMIPAGNHWQTETSKSSSPLLHPINFIITACFLNGITQVPSRLNPHADYVSKDLLCYIHHRHDYSVLNIQEIGWSKVVRKASCKWSFWSLCFPLTHQ